MIKKIKKLALGFTLLLTLQYLSNLTVTALHIKFPSALLAMIFLAILLKVAIIKISWVEDICELLLKNMALFFIPLFVGIISYASIIKQNILPIMATVTLTTFLTMALSAIIVEKTIEFINKKEAK